MGVGLVWTGLWVILAGLAAAVVLALILRWGAACRLSTAPRWVAQVHLAPTALGWPRLRLYDSTRRRSRKPQGSRPAHRSAIPRPPAGLPRALRREGAALMRVFRIDHLMVKGRFGTGDPADTGAAYGMLCPLLYGLRLPISSDIAVEPDFTRAVCDAQAELRVSFVPLRLVGPLARLAWRMFGPRP